MALPQPVIVLSRTDAVVENLTSYISEVGLVVGERLPAERELASALGVSRPILREALKHLAALGIVETKTGSGSFLRDPISLSDLRIVMKLETERQSLIKLVELRRALESEAAALAAKRISPAELDNLERLLDALEHEHFSKGHASETDKAFHLALYRYSGNPLFLQLLEPLWNRLENLWDKPLSSNTYVGKDTLPMHRMAFNFISQGDAEGARKTIYDMLTLVERDLQQDLLSSQDFEEVIAKG